MKESKAEGEKEGFRGRGRGVQNKAPSIKQVEKRHSSALSKRIHSLNVTMEGESGRSWEGHPSIHNLTLRLSVRTNSIPLPVQFTSLYKHDKCTFCYQWMCHNPRKRERRRRKSRPRTVVVKIRLLQVLCQSAIREMWARVKGYLCLAALVGILGWREQVMAFWSALIYTPPFLSLSSVKRWERWGAASSPVSCTCLGWEDQLWTLTLYLPRCTFITHPI